MTDRESVPRWAMGIYDVRVTSAGSAGLDLTFAGVGRFLGQRIESPRQVVEFELNRACTVKSISGSLAFVLHHTFEPAGSGTRVVFISEMFPGYYFKLAEPVLPTGSGGSLKQI